MKTPTGSSLVPLSDRVVVRPEKAKDKSEGGILIPEAAKAKPLRGTVIAVGPGAWNPEATAIVPMSVKVGDVVMYSAFSGGDVEIGGEEFKVLREFEILGKIE